jgi:hypothetical protein
MVEVLSPEHHGKPRTHGLSQAESLRRPLYQSRPFRLDGICEFRRITEIARMVDALERSVEPTRLLLAASKAEGGRGCAEINQFQCSLFVPVQASDLSHYHPRLPGTPLNGPEILLVIQPP